MDVTSIATSLAGMTAGRTQLEVGTAVLDRALDVSTSAALQLISSMVPAASTVPAGLTYSPAGLSAATGNRHVWTL